MWSFSKWMFTLDSTCTSALKDFLVAVFTLIMLLNLLHWMYITDLQRFLCLFICAFNGNLAQCRVIKWMSNCCVVVDNFFFPDHTLTCKLLSEYTKPVKRRKTCWKGIDADAVKESHLKLLLIHIQSLKKVLSWYYSCSQKEELDNTSYKIQIVGNSHRSVHVVRSPL